MTIHRTLLPAGWNRPKGYSNGISAAGRLVFTAGIGEHSAPIRARVCRGLGLFGVDLDDDANRANAHVISHPTSRVKVVVEPTNEAWIAARAAWRLVCGQAAIA